MPRSIIAQIPVNPFGCDKSFHMRDKAPRFVEGVAVYLKPETDLWRLIVANMPGRPRWTVLSASRFSAIRYTTIRRDAAILSRREAQPGPERHTLHVAANEPVHPDRTGEAIVAETYWKPKLPMPNVRTGLSVTLTLLAPPIIVTEFLASNSCPMPANKKGSIIVIARPSTKDRKPKVPLKLFPSSK